jgi:hypothetical protein
MSTVRTQHGLQFLSRPYERRIGLIPMSVFLGLGWTLSVASILVASWFFRYYALYSSIWIFAACGLAVYFALVTGRWIKDSRMHHELTLDQNRIRLVSRDARTNQQFVQSLDQNAVKSAEYYRAQDAGSILLNGRNEDLDIPLWSFGPGAEQKIVTWLREHDIPITTVP